VPSESLVEGELHVFREVVEDLRLPKEPESKEDQKDGCPLSSVEGQIVKLLVHFRRLGVVVSK